MKVFYSEIEHSYFGQACFKLGRVEHCCDLSEEAWAENFVSFGEFDSMLNTDNNVNITSCSPYPEGAVWNEMPISFCPFCSTEILMTRRA